jgi:hypothetical protein
MKNVFIMMVGLVLLFSVVIVFADDKPETTPKDSTEVTAIESVKSQESDQVVVYYLHMNRRCMTCGKLETYSKEAVKTGFAEQLKDSSIVFVVENFETEGNEHFAKDYQLYSQSLILSRQHDGKETEWKNLDKIWKLVGNKEDFITYVQTEVTDFLNTKEEE